ncbi:hypothetical protein Nepgr_013637 [Nepenthes gracilis]|uniref:TOG domain-containing protein n=1 Tax=Nepenthes gracilis TaxID=150966 RepID=A0AAD3SJJ1_NEPGR|nr:hypothetical protein Nepgr_013637 [Nepenthes gracilis]
MRTQLKPNGATRVKPQQVIYELKHQVVLALNKLTDRDTHQIGVDELEKIAESLTHERITPFLSCILDIDSEQKSAVRKECIRMMGVLVTIHGGLTGPHLGKMVSSIVKRLKDSDSIVRDMCVETVGILARKLGNQHNESDGAFVTLVKPFFEALGEHNKQVQSGAALCLARIIDSMNDNPVSILQRMLTRTTKLLKNPHFMAKPAVIELNRSLIQAGGAPSRNNLSAAVGSIQEALKSSDWMTRKAASLALEEIGSSGGSFFAHLKASCIHSLESCRFDKVKPVRDAVLQALHLWRTIPDLEVPELTESGSCTKENLCGGDHSDLASFGGSVWEGVAPKESNLDLDKKRSPLFIRNERQNDVTKSNKSQISDWRIEVPSKSNNPTSQDIHYEESEECSSASNTVSDNFANKIMTVSYSFSDEDSIMKPSGKGCRFTSKGNCGEAPPTLSKMCEFTSPTDGTSLDSTVTDSVYSHTVHVCPQNEIVSIQKQLLEIETRQSNLMDLLQEFMTRTMKSLSIIQSKVSGLEQVVDSIAHGLSCGGTCTDFLCAEFVNKGHSIASPMLSAYTSRLSEDTHVGQSSVLPLRNAECGKEKMLGSCRQSSTISQVIDTWRVPTTNMSENLVGEQIEKSRRQEKRSTGCSQTRITDVIFAAASDGYVSQNGQASNIDIWKRVKGCLSGGDLDSAYREALCSENRLLLIELLDSTGPVVESLSYKTISDLFRTMASCLGERRFMSTIIPWLQQVVDLSAANGPNYITLSSKAKKELLSAIHGNLKAQVSHPVERRLVMQLAMKLQEIWGKAIYVHSSGIQAPFCTGLQSF